MTTQGVKFPLNCFHFSSSIMNNLYIINEVLSDYTPGMAVIAAPDLKRCREIFVEKFAYNDLYEGEVAEYDSAIEGKYYKVIEGVNHNEGVVSYVWEGG